MEVHHIPIPSYLTPKPTNRCRRRTVPPAWHGPRVQLRLSLPRRVAVTCSCSSSSSLRYSLFHTRRCRGNALLALPGELIMPHTCRSGESRQPALTAPPLCLVVPHAKSLTLEGCSNCSPQAFIPGPPPQDPSLNHHP